MNSTCRSAAKANKATVWLCLVLRVAAPCVCFVPWAALASCRPRPQQLLLVFAAGNGRRSCSSQPIGMSTGRTAVKTAFCKLSFLFYMYCFCQLQQRIRGLEQGRRHSCRNQSPSGAFKRQSGLAQTRWRGPAPTSSGSFPTAVCPKPYQKNRVTKVTTVKVP